jgi:hypothetical protein
VRRPRDGDHYSDRLLVALLTGGSSARRAPSRPHG